MEQVVKEMSHLFQFFPKEVAPLGLPANQLDAIDVGSKLLFFLQYLISLINFSNTYVFKPPVGIVIVIQV